MWGFIVGRLVSGVLVIFLVITAVFIMTHMTGDPVLLFTPMDTSPKDIDQIRDRLGFNDPLYVQYGRFLDGVAHGSFGDSTREQRPATEVVLERLPATIELGAAALAISILIGVPLGILAATKHGSIWDRLASLLAVVGQAIPGFWLGLLLILLFSVSLRWLPTSGRGGWQHLIMPAVTLAALSTAQYARLTRSTMLDVLREDYIRTAHAKGLASGTVIARHAFKNASISLLTLTGLQVGRLLGGSVVIEQVFAWPGMGRATVQALLNRDFSVVMAAVVIFAITYTLANLLTDLAYAWVNPQVRLS
jgi:peptide/nickel transport system permease protein